MNKVILSGRIAKDLDLRYTTNNSAVLDFPFAVKRTKEEADFIQVVAYNKTAELISQYCKKGSSLNIVGKLKTRKYEDKDGKMVYVTEVYVDEVEFVSGNKNENQKQENQIAEDFKPVTDSELPF